MRWIVATLVGVAVVVGAENAVYAGAWPSDTAFEAGYPIAPEACWPLPLWYPGSWELVEHTPCPPGYYLPPPFHHVGYRHPPLARGFYHHVLYTHGYIHRRPFLRPGWWW
jgi:hypothetical protein